MIQDFPLSKLRLLERNPRRITKKQLDKLQLSLQDDPEFLQKRPVLVNHIDGKYVVYAGNQRVSAARKLGWKTIPCDIDENLDDKKMRKRILTDNFNNGDWDWDCLANDYEPDELLDAGFTPQDLHFDMPDIENSDNSEKEKKLKKCPECGCEF